jgi:hypothetical protein
MAFEKVRNSNTLVRAAAMEVGDQLTGYVTGFTKFQQEGEEPQVNMTMQLTEPFTGEVGSQKNAKTETLAVGTIITLGSAGNIKYDITDGRVKQGLLTRITKTADKSGKKGARFDVEQDADMIIDEALLNAASIDPSELKTTGATNRNAGNGVSKQELERAAIKERAAKVKEQATGS